MSNLTDLIWVPGSHEDPRRKIIDITPRIKIFSISDIDGLKLGNHYHKRTQESFYAFEGKLHYKLEDIRTKERQEYTTEPGQGINIPLFIAHLLIPDRRAIFIGILKTDFDPTDLNKYEITW